jgi:PAS domain S-box-containing protein
VAEAREMVRDLLGAADGGDLLETAVLLVSEVVTNALLHAGTPIEVRASLDADGVRIEVGDGSPHLPVRRHYGATAGTGRGLMLLEQLADDWGIVRTDLGKRVWFLLSADGVEAAGTALHGPRAAGRARVADSVAVELRNMPLLLHGAWREHAETLLREYLLARLDEGDDPIRVHAEATDAIAVLGEHVPDAEVAVRADRLMADATEPRVSAAVVEVPVPRVSVPHFATLEQAIEEALALSEDGSVLAPPTQPEIRAFRRWLCGQVLDQAAGDAPVAWSMETSAPPSPELALDWDASGTRAATVPTVAADEANRLIAVSPSLLDLLGYDDPGQLVGRRIVEVIPHRFRQAHIAGFTMFLLVGRRPLVDTPVVVPALRRDGSEVEVELTVSVHPAGDGRSVFVAELRPTEG